MSEAKRRKIPSTGIVFEDLAPSIADFRAALLAGFSKPAREIPCRFLYDARGSALFDEICNQPEYYPTRTELGILGANADEMAALIGPRGELIELGSGASTKVALLLDAMTKPARYVPIDISADYLRAAAQRVADERPELQVHAICADYGQPFALPPARLGGRRVAFYPGSTIGNMTPVEAEAFLTQWRRRLGAGGDMIVGVDLKKDAAILNAAYDDNAGVTAAFSKNVLERANREADADFDLTRFAHQARYSAAKGCVEIHLRSLAGQRVQIAGERFDLSEGELIHIEDSFKYTLDEFRRVAVSAGFRPRACWTDENGLFSVHYLVSGPSAAAE